MTSNVDKHAEMVDAGWSMRLDGKWQAPDPHDHHGYDFATAWCAHLESTERRTP